MFKSPFAFSVSFFPDSTFQVPGEREVLYVVAKLEANGGGGLRKPLFKNIHINSEKNRMQILSSGIDRTQEGLPWKNN